METPVLIVNLKTYEQGSGRAAAAVGRACDRVAADTGAAVAVAVQNADVDRISDAVSVPVLAQHLDPVRYGSHTGSQLAETLAFNGADGVLINHSEDQVPRDAVRDAVRRAQDVGLETVVCADSPDMAGAAAGFGPDFVAYEPPALIGGDVSVASAKPELVEDAVAQAGDATVLTGAGVKDRGDVAAALDLGTRGVLVASGVVTAEDPEAAVRDLVAGFPR